MYCRNVIWPKSKLAKDCLKVMKLCKSKRWSKISRGKRNISRITIIKVLEQVWKNHLPVVLDHWFKDNHHWKVPKAAKHLILIKATMEVEWSIKHNKKFVGRNLMNPNHRFFYSLKATNGESHGQTRKMGKNERSYILKKSSDSAWRRT